MFVNSYVCFQVSNWPCAAKPTLRATELNSIDNTFVNELLILNF